VLITILLHCLMSNNQLSAIVGTKLETKFNQLAFLKLAKRHLIWHTSNLKNHNSYGILQTRRTNTFLSYLKIEKRYLSSHTPNPRTTFLLSYLKLEERQLIWHITNSKNDNSPLMLQTRVENQNVFLLI
jgi:hypothetical protein